MALAVPTPQPPAPPVPLLLEENADKENLLNLPPLRCPGYSSYLTKSEGMGVSSNCIK